MMETVIHLLAFILPIIALGSVFLIACVNIYFKIRRKLPAKVNCWFCNQWTKVHYDDTNSFDCPSCLQYNGFTSDGDYNKLIPAQHNELLNRSLPISKCTSQNFSNGLCHLCNHNQQLRIYQLANFVPLDESNFDTEIEHFQKQLDKAYKLCAACDQVVKTTIRKQNCLLGLKFFKLRKKGLLLDLNKSHDGISRKDKRVILESLMNAVLVSFSLLHLVYVIVRADFSDVDFKKFIPEFLHVSAQNFTRFSLVRSTCNNLNLFNEGLGLSYLNSTRVYLDEISRSMVTVDNLVLMSLVACLLQFIMFAWNFPDGLKKNFWKLISWILLVVTDWKYSINFSKFVTALQIMAIITILVLMCSSNSSKFVRKKKTKRMPKRMPTKNYEEDISDSDDFKNSILPPKSKTNLLSNGSPKSFCDNSSIFTLNDSLNKSFVTSKSCFTDVAQTANKKDDNSFGTASLNEDFDLGVSLNRLHLSNPPLNYYVNPTVNRPRPVISPAKFRNSTSTAGFWRDSNGISMPNSNYQHVSRSSSQTSGFVSQSSTTDPHYFSPLPPNNSFYGDLEYNPAYLDPVYNANLIHRRNMNSYCPKFPYENHHFNRERLVYVTPNLINPYGSFYDYVLCKSNFSPSSSCKENGLKCSVCNNKHHGENK